MNRIIEIKIFNDRLDQFFEYLHIQFPFFNSDIILTQNAISFIRKSNPRLVVEQFLHYVEPYSIQIFDCDEDFFLDFEHNIELDRANLLYGLKLKRFFLENQNNDTGLRQKATVFNHFQKLLVSGRKCIL